MCCLVWKNVLPSTSLTKERSFSCFSFFGVPGILLGISRYAVHVVIAEQATGSVV